MPIFMMAFGSKTTTALSASKVCADYWEWQGRWITDDGFKSITSVTIEKVGIY